MEQCLDKPIIWVDLEMTGLNYKSDVIMEIAVVVTGSQTIGASLGAYASSSQRLTFGTIWVFSFSDKYPAPFFFFLLILFSRI